MKENRYDDPNFFERYSQMPRSRQGLAAAGEWPALRKVLPGLRGKRILDLGCGFGWHCRYAVEQGAASVTGVDLSEKMLAEAQKAAPDSPIKYMRMAIEDIDFSENSFDVVISSLAFHYVRSFNEVSRKVNRCLSSAGSFVFSVEHPVFTAQGRQEWCCDDTGKKLCWPVDRYFEEGARQTNFLGEEVVKYHRTLTTYVSDLTGAGFQLVDLVEPQPEPEMLAVHPEYMDELRRPMMLIMSARKP